MPPRDNRRKKRYGSEGWTIEVDFKAETINYPVEIKLGDKTTSNFQSSENFVVLECVDRLLTKGYPPDCIELEHKWPLGHRFKGKLDILVKERDAGVPYLMIECKTHPEEYEREKGRMQKNGGQLFSYWQQDRNAEYLCLYTSFVSEGEVKYESAIVHIEDAFRSLGDVAEVYNRWNKQFAYKGLFEPQVNPFGVGSAPLLRSDLKPLKEADGKRIYLQFLEILRHNVVSDKGNAFNKIFNLFLCKIVDEEKRNGQQLDFQWLEGRDTDVSMLGRLNALYKLGMDKYLNKDVTDYSVEDIAGSELLDEDARRKITELRLYKNQEFAFVEVFNEDSFRQNARIVIEMVRLLERWQIRYTHKQQFLGEFFELLLNTGFKQESGQYFTPVPLVQFIVMSLPIEDIVHDKIGRGELHFLPYTIDFACGSGHFLTEVMDMLERLVQNMPTSSLDRPQERKLHSYRADTLGWAEEYVYGIEFDYRLAKTSKLACFLNGDGEAQILHASGLEPFDCETYWGRLKASGRNNQQFDILVANPPYAVKGFKATVNNGAASFALFDKLGDKSDNIEVLFVERMAQLVRPGGVVGIVLHLSLITGGKVYEDTRRILLENFEVNGIVLLGSGAFMATGINTVILFLRKRHKAVHLETVSDYREVCRGRSVVVVTCGEKDVEKRFLGYEFSRRRGSEGIKIRRESRLLDKSNPDSHKHVNGYILANMRGSPWTDIDPVLSEHVRVRAMRDLFHWDESGFSNAFVFKKYRLSYPQADRLVSLRSVIGEIEQGKRPRGGVSEITSGAWSLGGEHIDGATCEIVTDGMKYVPEDYFLSMTRGVVRGGDILVNKDGALTGKAALFYGNGGQDVCVNEHLYIIRANEDIVCQKYLFYFLVSDFFQQQVVVHAHQKNGQPGLNLKHVGRIRFLVLDKQEQDLVVARIDERWDNLLGGGERKRYANEVFTDFGLMGEHA